MGSFHAPGQRYHPVISAHAIATVAAMFPGRLPWVALGSGEALNEHVTGDAWPTKPLRMERLRECVDVMRALWRGEEVTHDGLGHGGRGAAVVAARGAARAGRRGDQRADGGVGGAVGRWPDHGQSAAATAAPGDRPRTATPAVVAIRTCRSTCPTRRPTTRRCGSPSTSGAATACPTCWPGICTRRSSSRRPPGTCPPAEVARNVRVSGRPRPAPAVAGRVPRPRLRRAVPAPRRPGQQGVHRAFGATVLPTLRGGAR